MLEERVLGAREMEKDDFSRYRQRYPGRRRRDHTWKHKIESYARYLPEMPAVSQGERRLNWRELNRRCNRLAHGLMRLGIGKEDRVAISGFNSIEWMEAYFAASKIGAVPVNVNPRFVAGEVKYVLEDSDAVAVFVEEDYAGTVDAVRAELPALRHCVVYGVGREPRRVPAGALAYEEVLARNEDDPAVKVYNDDFCYLMYTGGTTGYPKGTVWDGEQRLRGLEMMMINGLLPVLDRMGELSRDNLKGFLSVFIGREESREKAASLMTRKAARKMLASPLTKTALLYGFKAISGNLAAMKAVNLARRDNQGVRVLPVSPFFHGAGYEGCFAQIASMAAAAVLLPTPHPFDAREFWEAVERERAHSAVIVGDAFAIPMVEELRRAREEGRIYDTRSLFGIISSGARWSPHVKRELLEYAPGMLVFDEMGASETSAAFSEMTTAADDEIKLAGARLSGASGGLHAKAVFPCRVLDPETGRDVEPGSGRVGEFVYGGYMALGYWKCPSKTARDFRVVDGRRWFFVGDEGLVDADGKFSLIGRGGDYVINTGGEKVYSEEVEAVIKENPAVFDVAVVGIPDPRWGQAVTALVEAVPGKAVSEEDILDFCRERMAGYKRPRHVFFVDRVPRAASGKIDRATAMLLLSERLGSS